MNTQRSGAALVETTFLILLFLMLVLGMLDIGVGLFRYHILSQAARRGARQAIVQGSLAPGEQFGGPWGPATYTHNPGAASDNVFDAFQPFLVGHELESVTVQIEWPNDSNVADGTNQVRVTVSAPYRPITIFYPIPPPPVPPPLGGGGAINFTATSTMIIAH